MIPVAGNILAFQQSLSESLSCHNMAVPVSGELVQERLKLDSRAATLLLSNYGLSAPHVSCLRLSHVIQTSTRYKHELRMLTTSRSATFRRLRKHPCGIHENSRVSVSAGIVLSSTALDRITGLSSESAFTHVVSRIMHMSSLGAHFTDSMPPDVSSRLAALLFRLLSLSLTG